MTGYRRAIVTRWSHRDRLAVLVVAMTVAFLVGATLLLLAAGGQATAVAAEYTGEEAVTYHESVESARTAAGSGDVVVPVARASVEGDRVVVVGLPASGNRADLHQPRGSGATLGTIAADRSMSVAGQDATLDLEIAPRERRGSVFPPHWYVANVTTVDRLGTAGAFVIGAPGATGAPLRGVLPFFVIGTRQAVTLLGLLAAGGAVLVGVTVYSVSQMTVRDRRKTIRLVRATGGTPRAVLTTFAARGALLTATGVLVGYAVGVVVASGAVTLSIAAGLPTSLVVRVTPEALRILGPLLGGLVLVGTGAGTVAAWPTARGPPARILDPHARSGRQTHSSGWIHDALGLALLDRRALVPTAATLTAFVTIVVVVAGMASVAGPVASPGVTTITEPGASHPVASSVPAAYSEALRDRDIPASAEILAFAVHDGQPFVVRGANATAFTGVTDATLARGRFPAAPDEAAIGADLARSLNRDVGDSLTLGGSTREAVGRVEIVGVYRAPGLYDDQLLVSLALARHLAGVAPGQAQFVRAARLPDAESPRTTRQLTVVDLAAPDRVPAGRSFAVQVTVRNEGLQQVREPVAIRVATQRIERAMTVGPRGERSIRARFTIDSPGTYRLRAGGADRRLRVLDPQAIRLRVPDPIPAGATPVVRVLNGSDRPVADASVTVDNRTYGTDANGTVRVRFDEPGRHDIHARVGERATARTVTVQQGIRRYPNITVRIRPQRPTTLVRPRVRVAADNPWNRSLRSRLRIDAPGVRTNRTVALAPGERTTLELVLPRRPPGSYTVRVGSAGTELATEPYTVGGDERLLSALAASGRQGTTGIGQSATVVFGNLRVLLGAIVLLAGAMTVGGTTASFARAVHARRRAVGIRRATGAGPATVVRLVLVDALLIGTSGALIATVAGFAILAGLAAAGRLVAFGVQIPVLADLWLVAGVFAGALGVALASAGLATVALIRTEPARLLASSRTSTRMGGPEDG